MLPTILSCRSEEHTSELQSHLNLVCRLLLEKKQTNRRIRIRPGSESDEGKFERNTHTSRYYFMTSSVCHTSSLKIFVLRTGFFFFKDPAPPEISPLPLHAALPI